MSNPLRTFFLLTGLIATFLIVGDMAGGGRGILIGLVLALGLGLVAYLNADRFVLALYRARAVDGTDPDPRIQAFVKDTLKMAEQACMPLPRIYLTDQSQPNAFTAGRDPAHASVIATQGMIEVLNRREIRAVMAHELAHIISGHTLPMTLTASMAGTLSALGSLSALSGILQKEERQGARSGRPGSSLLAPVAAALVRMSIRRHRVFQADRIGADICGDPEALASALRKIAASVRDVPNRTALVHPATSHLFIVNPLRRQGFETGSSRLSDTVVFQERRQARGVDALFSTHPDTGQRVAALLDMANRRC